MYFERDLDYRQSILCKISQNPNPMLVIISGSRLSRRFMPAIQTESSRIRMGFTRHLFACKRRGQMSVLRFLISRNPGAIANAIRRRLSAFLSLSGDGVLSRRSQCDLGTTLDNLAKFIEEFPSYCEQSSRIITEIEKEQKLEEIARDTIRATVSHIMESTKYSWNLYEFENTFSLEVSIIDEYTVEMDFDTQNYLERIPALQSILKQTENFLKEIPFPITIQLQEKS